MTGAYTTLLKPLVADGRIDRIVVCDVNAEAAERAARRFGDVGVVADHHDVIHDDAIDVVVVLTSMAEHGPFALEALQAGKHVFVEKPMAVDRALAAELLATARTSAGHLVCAPAVILSPTFRRDRRRAAGGSRSAGRPSPVPATGGRGRTGASGITASPAGRCSISGSTT